jgi:hypothetical protein
MEKTTIKNLEETFDEYLEKIEKDDPFLFETNTGNVLVGNYNDDELIRIHTELNNEAQ